MINRNPYLTHKTIIHLRGLPKKKKKTIYQNSHGISKESRHLPIKLFFVESDKKVA
jgi:hypothetical protein